VKGSFSLDALGNVDGELDTIVTESAGGDSAVDGSTAVTTEDGSVGHLALSSRCHRHRVEIHRHGRVLIRE